MNPLERFLARIRAIREQIDRLPDETVEQILADLELTRRQVIGEIAGTEVGSYQAFRLAELNRSLRDVMNQFNERYRRIIADPQQRLYDLGQELAARPIVDAGVTYGVPQINRRALEVAQALQAILITNMTAEEIGNISAEIYRGVQRKESMFEIAQRVAGSLSGPSTFGTIATRAEAITRTELGRIQAIATQAGLEETKRFVPDLQKMWMHSGNTGKYARLGHMDANGQTRDVADAYRISPGPGKPFEDMQYPRDPNASPSNTVFCGCLSVPHRAEWVNELRRAA